MCKNKNNKSIQMCQAMQKAQLIEQFELPFLYHQPFNQKIGILITPFQNNIMQSAVTLYEFGQIENYTLLQIITSHTTHPIDYIQLIILVTNNLKRRRIIIIVVPTNDSTTDGFILYLKPQQIIKFETHETERDNILFILNLNYFCNQERHNPQNDYLDSCKLEEMLYYQSKSNKLLDCLNCMQHKQDGTILYINYVMILKAVSKQNYHTYIAQVLSFNNRYPYLQIIQSIIQINLTINLHY
ncbi:hypothetical protein pb186bvf_017271 [Paramecium bursaria]